VTERTVVVVYDDGAARPADIAVGLAEWAHCVFIAAPNEHTRMMRPLLGQFGPVLTAESESQVIREARAHHPDGLVTYSEQALGLATRVAVGLSLPFHSPRVYRLLTDKWAQRDALRTSGVDSVRCHRISQASDWADAVAATGLPAVLKPANGGGSRNTYLISDAAVGLELVKRVLAAERPGLVVGGTVVLEEYLPSRDCSPFGDFVSVENIVCEGAVADIAVTGKFPLMPPFRETGHFWPAPLGQREDIQVRQLARRAVEALGVGYGITQTEIKLTPRGPRVIEVNGRLGGNLNELSIRATGINLVETAARAAVGDPVQPFPPYQGRPRFVTFHPAPRQPCTLRGVSGADEVRRIPGVDLYRPYARAGARLHGGVGLQELGIIMGEAADFADLAAVRERVDSTLVYHFSFADGNRSVNAKELARL
jgi:hypothetical protein